MVKDVAEKKAYCEGIKVFRYSKAYLSRQKRAVVKRHDKTIVRRTTAVLLPSFEVAAPSHLPIHHLLCLTVVQQ